MNPHQSAVLEFQTKVAGQPIPDPFVPQRVQPAFYDRQNIIMFEEWSEFLGHMDDKTFREADARAWRLAIADDLADTAFTLYGIANVVGVPLFIMPIARDPGVVFNMGNEICMAWDGIDRLYGSKYDHQSVATECSVLIARLCDIGVNQFINVPVALTEVCECNMTKLWTSQELVERHDEIEKNAWHVQDVKLATGQPAYRVLNTSGKLMKSKYTRQPDHTKALMA